jgi:hypothetical protein
MTGKAGIDSKSVYWLINQHQQEKIKVKCYLTINNKLPRQGKYRRESAIVTEEGETIIIKENSARRTVREDYGSTGTFGRC